MHKPEIASQGVVIVVEDTEHLAPTERAKALSLSTGFPIVKPLRYKDAGLKAKGKGKTNNELAQWQLVFTQRGLVLRLTSEPTWGDIFVDFASDALHYRKQFGGGRNEAIAKAIGIKGKESLSVIDCTAGMGKDSFVMASVGANVQMVERSPIIAALLDDALYRAQDIIETSRLQLLQGNATELLNSQQLTPAQVIYLDPMFPHKKKSALVKKEMRAFQQLLGADLDSSDLLAAALKYATERVVVKRPSYAEAIELPDGRQPSMAIVGKKHRFDVYILHC